MHSAVSIASDVASYRFFSASRVGINPQLDFPFGKLFYSMTKKRNASYSKISGKPKTGSFFVITMRLPRVGTSKSDSSLCLLIGPEAL